MRFVLLICLYGALNWSLSAQGFSGGFKAGLNFNTFSGETEMSNGMSLESFSRTTGFHVGATFAYAVTDLFGFKADLMYSQKGVQQDYEGRSYFFVYGETTEEVIGGQRNSELDIINSYVDIPVQVYYRIGPLEVAAGASMGLLINSAGAGGAIYTETVYGPDTEISFNYESNFFADEAGRGSIISLNETPVPGTNVRLPSSVGGYYNNATDENLFRRLDFGLVADVAFYLNSGLYIGGRYNLGLSDVTRVENDLAGQLGANNERQFRDDKDKNRSIQISLGFRF